MARRLFSAGLATTLICFGIEFAGGADHVKVLAKCPPFLVEDPSDTRISSMQRHKFALPPGSSTDSFDALAPLLAPRLAPLAQRCVSEGSLKCRGGRHTVRPAGKHSTLQAALRMGHLELELGCDQSSEETGSAPPPGAAAREGKATGGTGAMGTFPNVPESMGGYTAASPELAGAAQTGGRSDPNRSAGKTSSDPTQHKQ